MLDILKKEAKARNHRISVIPIERLAELEQELKEFKEKEELNGLQRWILTDVYKFDLSKEDFTVKSLIIVAVPHPMYANVNIHYEGKVYKARGLAGSNVSTATAYIKDIIHEAGFSAREESWALPLKRLAVQSGIATYGRNNITYVEGLGSNVSYIAFFTDAEAEEDLWRPMSHAEICDKCGICFKACPTGAIRKDRFLLDTQRCLAYMNENEGEFPDWLPKDVHHTLYDCLRCQEKCPMNLKVKDSNEEIVTVDFSEEETAMLLAGKKKEDFPEEFIKRTEILGIFYWQIPLSRNIQALIEANNTK